MGCTGSAIPMVLLPSPPPVVQESEKYLGLDCIFIGTDKANETVSNKDMWWTNSRTILTSIRFFKKNDSKDEFFAST